MSSKSTKATKKGSLPLNLQEKHTKRPKNNMVVLSTNWATVEYLTMNKLEASKDSPRVTINTKPVLLKRDHKQIL
jgi:hypothetical protein